jgi:1,4-alpha-glucan branching enzyme
MSRPHAQHGIKHTRFHCCAPAARAVFLAGTFNGWNPTATPLSKDTEGNWEKDLRLPSGHYEYKFVVDGEWCSEPESDGQHNGCGECVPNSFGTLNRVVDIA